ncbi:hypothetical protein FSP39_010318 [Pinctada imbricata]|uniref:Condensin complex subunit 1 n=1 Tax=Pinctada imbricata TaxID=66713 RepID=A0AA89C3T5_PINIB|nr:hypothetical protein FSP39_010318 [Pinctada imbricata]
MREGRGKMGGRGEGGRGAGGGSRLGKGEIKGGKGGGGGRGRMSFEFVVPSSRNDLLNKTGISHYVVDEVLTLREIPSALQGAKNSFRSNGCRCVLDKFDVFFSIVCLKKDVQADLKDDAWQLLLKVGKSLATDVAKVLEDTSLETEIRQDNLNMVKMLCYLICQYMEMFEESHQEAGQVITTGKGRGKGSKKASSADSIDWETERENGVKCVLHIVTQDLLRLWDPPIAEVEFVNMVTNCVYKLLENTNITYVRSKETRDAINNIIGIMVKRYNHALSASLKILQLLQHFEHLVNPLADMVEVITNQYGNRSVVGEIMREVGRKDPKDLARDNSGTRSFSSFLVEVAEKVPSVMLTNISVLMCHLEGESYTMRNGVLGILSEILLKVLSKEDLEEKMKDARDQFLEKLEEHVHDIHAFVRSRVLQIWLTLVNEKCIPLPRHEHLLELIIGRLHDKSSQVRKQAIQLVTAFIKCNPFAAKLPLEDLKSNYEKEKEKLEEMGPQETDQSNKENLMKKIEDEWLPFENKLKSTIQDQADMETESTVSDDLIGESESADSVIERIFNMLTEEKFTEALALLTSFKESFPGNPLLTENSESQSMEVDGEESRSSTESTPDLTYLRAIFYGHKKQSLVISAGGMEDKQQEDTTVINEFSKQQILVQYLKDCLAFATQIQAAVPIICQLLGSKTVTDVLEAIDFFVTGFEFGVTATMMGIRRMLHLIWSRESGVKDAVVSAYKRLYLNPQGGNQRAKANAVVKNLSALVSGATLGDLTSMEGLMVELMKAGEIDNSVIQMLWERFAMKVPNTTQDESKAAIKLIAMVAGADMGVVKSNIDVLVKEGLGDRAVNDFILARDTCLALLKLGTKKKAQGALPPEPYRLPQGHEMFTRLHDILVNGSSQLNNPYWVPLSEQAVNVIYKLAEHPDVICGDIIKQMAKEVIKAEKLDQTKAQEEQENTEMPTEDSPPTLDDSQPSSQPQSCASSVLTRLISLAGHVAFRQMVHLDTHIFGELKRRRAIQEHKSQTKTPKSTRKSLGKDRLASEAIEDELGLAGAAAEDADAEYIRKVCEMEIVTGDTLLSSIGPLLETVCVNQNKYADPDLRTAASLALAKFMLVSSEFCETHLQLLFTILEKSSYPTIRANTIIALGDLTIRFPNLIEPWTPHMYARLRDESPKVKKNTLQVLTHLILNDMVKVKGQISEMATCIVDSDERISSMAKLFFLELSRKGNAIYNIMPDIISRLSDPDVGVDEENFRTILKYLFSFIQKDRQCESLVEKLCHRFRSTKTDRQWRDLSFCLSMLSYSEKSIRKLQENFACYGDKLAEDEVYNCFCTIISKSRSFAKPTAKTLIDELEQRLIACHTKGLEEGDIAVKASQVSAQAKSKGKTPMKGKTPAKSGKTPGRRGRGRRIAESDDDSVDGDFRENKTPPKRQQGKRGTKQKPKISFDSDEDSEIELFDLDKSSQGTCNTEDKNEESSDSEPIPTKRTGRRVLNSSKKRVSPLQDLNSPV